MGDSSGELLRTCAALMGIFGAMMGGFLWLVGAVLTSKIQPVLHMLDAVTHAHTETRRRVEALEGRVDRMRDDKLDRGEADARIELALARVRTGATTATK